MQDIVFTGPNFKFIGTYKLDFSAPAFAPLSLVTIAEHIEIVVLGEIVIDLEEPGLNRTIMGWNCNFVSAAIGGPPNTTYENTGVVAMTKVASVYVIGVAEF